MDKIIGNLKENKKSLIILGILLLLVIITLVLKTTLSDPNTGYLRNQTVDGLSFEDAKLVYEDGITTFTAKIYNESGDIYNLKTISIDFKGTDNKTTTLTGYVGDSIDKDTGKYLRVSIDQDLSSSVSLEYKINK